MIRIAAPRPTIAVGSSAMRTSISNLALMLVLGACAGDAPAPVERPCTKSLYELCITEHDCDSNNCLEFAEEGYLMCTVGCDAANPCPRLNDEEVPCVSNVCKPAAPIECIVMQ
jgi:hypothetical protein